MKQSVHPAVIAVAIVLLLGGIIFFYQRGMDGGHIPEDKAALIREDLKNMPPMTPPGAMQQPGNAGGAPQGTAPTMTGGQ